MDSCIKALEAFDVMVAGLESARSLSELEQAFRDASRSYPFLGASFDWWAHPPPARPPDFQMSGGLVGGDAQRELDFTGDLWSDSRPRISREIADDGSDPVKVRVALLGPRRRFGVLTVSLSLDPADIERAASDWRGRFLLLAHVVQHCVCRWRPDAHPNLGRREVQCLKLAAEGLKAKQIASALGIGQQTVQFHLSRAREKLNCSNTVQAVARAAQFGLLPDLTPSETLRE